MVDYQSSVDSTTAPIEADGAAQKTGFLATTTGKLVVGGIAVVLVLAAIGVAVFYFLFGGAANSADTNVVQNPKPAASSTASGTPAAPVEPSERSLSSTFTFRNVFAPTIKREFEASTTADGSGTTSETAEVPANTLFLQSIVTEDGVQKAVFIWNDKTYTVAEGETVDSSPWKVLQINSDSVLMLYGDSQVTLSVGQGVGK